MALLLSAFSRARLLSAAAAAVVPRLPRVAALSSQASTDAQAGPGPGSRNRSLQQAQAAGETSNTAGPDSAPARSPDAPADPADLAAKRGSDPEEVLRTSAWQADQAMSSSYNRDDQGGASFIKHAPHMAGRFAEKAADAAGIAAQAATGAVSAMSDTVKAATGAAAGVRDGVRHGLSESGRALSQQQPDSRDASPVSDESAPWDDEPPQQEGGADATYTEAADRLMDIEGLPRKYSPSNPGSDKA